MIVNFLLMGDLYDHDPYSTEAAPWNSYPWHIGSDNGMEARADIGSFAMAKTIWRVSEDPDEQATILTSAGISSFSMFAALIIMDQWGNLGTDVGVIFPNSVGPEWILIPTGSAIGNATIVQTIFEDVLIDAEGNEQDYLTASNSSLVNVQSAQTLVIFQANPTIGEDSAVATSSSIVNVTSIQ